MLPAEKYFNLSLTRSTAFLTYSTHSISLSGSPSALTILAASVESPTTLRLKVEVKFRVSKSSSSKTRVARSGTMIYVFVEPKFLMAFFAASKRLAPVTTFIMIRFYHKLKNFKRDLCFGVFCGGFKADFLHDLLFQMKIFVFESCDILS